MNAQVSSIVAITLEQCQYDRQSFFRRPLGGASTNPLMDLVFLGYTERGDYLMLSSNHNAKVKAECCIYEVEAKNGRIRSTHFVAFPGVDFHHSPNVQEVTLSPSGKYLAWLRLSVQPAHKTWTYEIWRSRWEGQGLQRLYSQTLSYPNDKNILSYKPGDWSMCGLQWMPNGGNISFMFQRSVWSLAMIDKLMPL